MAHGLRAASGLRDASAGSTRATSLPFGLQGLHLETMKAQSQEFTKHLSVALLRQARYIARKLQSRCFLSPGLKSCDPNDLAVPTTSTPHSQLHLSSPPI